MQYRTRPAPCTHCGDTVLVAERPALKLFGYSLGKPSAGGLEHADPSPDGDVFDGVDDSCHRPPVRR